MSLKCLSGVWQAKLDKSVSRTLKWQYDQIFRLRFFCSNSSYSPNITYCASKNEFAKRFLEETGPL